MRDRELLNRVREILARIGLKPTHQQSGLDTRRIDPTMLARSGGRMPYRMKPQHRAGYRLANHVLRVADQHQHTMRIVWQPESDNYAATTMPQYQYVLERARAACESAGVRVITDTQYPYDLILLPTEEDRP